MKPLRPMFGRVLVLVIFVDGPPGTSAAFAPAETFQALLQTFVACGLLRRLAGGWGASQAPAVATPCQFVSATRTVTLAGLAPSAVPSPTGPTLVPPQPIATEFATTDRVWLDAALDALGVAPASPDPDVNFFLRVESLATSLSVVGTFGLGVDDVVPVFVTKYPAYWLGYAERRRFVVLHWPSLAASPNPNRISGVLAHELGHIFGAPDEYGGSPCVTSDTTGPFATPNANCEIVQRVPPPLVPNPASVPCLMRGNSAVICASTALHWGWADTDADGVADLVAAPTVTDMDARAGSPGDVVIVRGQNMWDARGAAFDGDVVTDISYIRADGSQSPLEQADPSLTFDLDRLALTVPGGSTGISTVSVSTRSGQSASPLADAWFLRAPAGTIPSGVTEPVVFGLLPISGPAGTSVTIFGANFEGVTDVTFGGVSAASIQEDSIGRQLTVEAPAGGFGVVGVVVIGTHGTSTPWALSLFTYV